MEETRIPQFYTGRKVFITGSSGFIGKILVWKLLKSCPDIDTIYVLLRSKRGKNATIRRDELLSYEVGIFLFARTTYTSTYAFFFHNFLPALQIFDTFRKENPEVLAKVVAIAGDVAEHNLGLSECDRETLISQVSVVFHSAAILKMDADLRSAINVNTSGTVRLLDLSLEMKNLQVCCMLRYANCKLLLGAI